MTGLARLRDAARHGVGRVVMAGLWFGLLTPLALVLRLVGRDALGIRTRPPRWTPRADPGSGDLERPF